MVTLWEVKGVRSGNVLIDEVKANSQSDARDKYEYLNPGYKAGSAKRV